MADDYHDFQEKLEEGHEGERAVALWLSKWGTVEMVTGDRALQRAGIDMMLTTPEGSMTVEVKTDNRARATGNAYLETVSVQTENGEVEKWGWVFTCSAKRLVYYVPGLSVSVLDPAALAKIVNANWTRFRVREAQNKDYWGMGLLVPLKTLYGWSLYTEML